MTLIGDEEFSGCTGLTNATIPDSATSNDYNEIVKMLMEAYGHRGAKILGKLFSLYEREAAGIRDEVISSCINEGLSYILLEMDGGDEVFESCFAPSKEYDIITAFRTDSPVDSAKFVCGVAMRESANR